VTGRFIEGSSVYLRPLEEDDYASRMPRWTSDRDVTRYLVRGTLPLTQEAHRRRYEELVKATDEVEMAVVDRTDGETIGVAGLHRIDPVARSGEFRILLGERDRWGRGIGTEVLQLLVAYGFDVLNLNKVWLGVNAGNESAARSYQKAGFTPEGVLRQEVYRNGRYYDVIRMSMLRAEYEDAVGSWPVVSEIRRHLRGSA